MKIRSTTFLSLATAMSCAALNFQSPAKSAATDGLYGRRSPEAASLLTPSSLIAQADTSDLAGTTEEIFLEGLVAFQTETQEGYKLAITNWESIEADVLASQRTEDIALLYIFLGRAYDLIGQNQSAYGYYEKALPAFRDAGDVLGASRTLNFMGLLKDGFGDRQAAFQLYAESLTLAEEVGDLEMQVTVLSNIGSTYNALVR